MQNRHVHGLDIKGRMATDDSYPYSGKNSPQNCWAKIFRSELAPVRVGGCVRVNDDSVKSGEPIYFALSLLGPAALGIDANEAKATAKYRPMYDIANVLTMIHEAGGCQLTNIKAKMNSPR